MYTAFFRKFLELHMPFPLLAMKASRNIDYAYEQSGVRSPFHFEKCLPELCFASFWMLFVPAHTMHTEEMLSGAILLVMLCIRRLQNTFALCVCVCVCVDVLQRRVYACMRRLRATEHTFS
jgi:hypothetical protein